jgi:alkylation response protein AidB-like acyl-CoA dehydrogenase
MALGTAQGALDRSLAYVKERAQFGKKIGEFQVNRHKLAEMFASLEQARFITYAAAAQHDAGKPNAGLSAAAKLNAGRTALGAAYEAIQLHGGYGYITEYEVERRYRDAKAIQIAGGNTHLLKDEIADHLFGKSKQMEY